MYLFLTFMRIVVFLSSRLLFGILVSSFLHLRYNNLVSISPISHLDWYLGLSVSVSPSPVSLAPHLLSEYLCLVSLRVLSRYLCLTISPLSLSLSVSSPSRCLSVSSLSRCPCLSRPRLVVCLVVSPSSRLSLSPPQKKKELEEACHRKTNVQTWVGLGLMGVQFGKLSLRHVLSGAAICRS